MAVKDSSRAEQLVSLTNEFQGMVRETAVQDSVGRASTERWIGSGESPHNAIPAPSAAARGNIDPASTEQRIEPNGNPHYAIPDPQPGVFPLSPLLPGVADTLKYDDGTAARALCQKVAGGGWGVKFISPADSVTLAGALVHFYGGWPRPGGSSQRSGPRNRTSVTVG